MRGRTTGIAVRLAGLAATLALVAAATAAAAGPGSGYRRQAHRLRVQSQRLDTRAHHALLTIYALDSGLAAARRRLTLTEARAERLRRRLRRLEQEAAAARQTLAVSRRQLAVRLRTLYEDGRPDPLGVVLGAQSLDDALAKLDTLTRFADQGRRLVLAARTSQLRLVLAQGRLAAQERRAEAMLAAERTAELALAGARTERLAYVERLRAGARLKEARIRSLLAVARSVERKSQQIEAGPAAAPAAASGVRLAAPRSGAAPPASRPRPTTPLRQPVGRTLRVTATGYSLGGHTATGLPVGWGVVAVDPSLIPLGTRLSIPGYGDAVAADVGSGVRGTTIDLWFPSLAQARSWGRRTVTITIR